MGTRHELILALTIALLSGCALRQARRPIVGDGDKYYEIYKRMAARPDVLPAGSTWFDPYLNGKAKWGAAQLADGRAESTVERAVRKLDGLIGRSAIVSVQMLVDPDELQVHELIAGAHQRWGIGVARSSSMDPHGEHIYVVILTARGLPREHRRHHRGPRPV
jgi:hypothetical protein